MAEAVRWYRLAADQGLAVAQTNLGIMYDKGAGVPEDEAEAARWFRLAADQGDADAQYNLGVMYANGEGVILDFVSAHMWFSSGGANGNNLGSEYRDVVEKRMTAEAIYEAERRARVCMASNYTNCD